MGNNWSPVASYWLVWPSQGAEPRDHLIDGRLTVEGRLGRYTVAEIVHWMSQGDEFRAHGAAVPGARVQVCRCPATGQPHLMVET